MDLPELNALPDAGALELFGACLGVRGWAARMAGSRPYATSTEMLAAAERAFDDVASGDWKDAILRHPRIGESRAAVTTGAREDEWSKEEQSAARGADAATRTAIATANAEYEARFGYRFIVCATGKGAAEVLQDLRARLPNDDATELLVTAGELRRIARLRLARLVPGA